MKRKKRYRDLLAYGISAMLMIGSCRQEMIFASANEDGGTETAVTDVYPQPEGVTVTDRSAEIETVTEEYPQPEGETDTAREKAEEADADGITEEAAADRSPEEEAAAVTDGDPETEEVMIVPDVAERIRDGSAEEAAAVMGDETECIIDGSADMYMAGEELTEEELLMLETGELPFGMLFAASAPVFGEGSAFGCEANWIQELGILTSVQITYTGDSKNVISRNKYYFMQEGDPVSGVWSGFGEYVKPLQDKTPVIFVLSPDDLSMDKEYQTAWGSLKNGAVVTEGISPESFTVTDILESVKSGFTGWLDEIWSAGSGVMPETTAEMYQAFQTYYDIPAVTITGRAENLSYYLEAGTGDSGASILPEYDCHWEYCDGNGIWQELAPERDAILEVADHPALENGGGLVRCALYKEGRLLYISNELMVDPKGEIGQQFADLINEELGLASYGPANADLRIGRKQFQDLFCYDHIPYKSAQQYRDHLVELYLDQGIGAVRTEWQKYLYDIYDPSLDLGNSNGGTGGSGYPDPGTYGDHTFTWPKDQGAVKSSPFHAGAAASLDNLSYSYLENGVDYSRFVGNVNKTATSPAPGDENEERVFDIDIAAKMQASKLAPVAMILEIQTTWQMFDLAHANRLAGNNDGTRIGACAANTELATLYDIKQALMRFTDYMDANHAGHNLLIGMIDVEHAGGFSMLSGTDSNGNPLYVSNNTDEIRNGLRGWDTFGNCEHVHYKMSILSDVINNVPSNLAHLSDAYGYTLSAEDIQKVAVMVGGPTENSSGEDGYGILLPWKTFQKNGINAVYSIRTNEGSPLNSDGVISWLDIAANNTGEPYDGTEKASYTQKNPAGSFTGKYVATDQDAFLQALIDIAERETDKIIEITSDKVFVENMTVEDVISDEFELDLSEPVRVIIYDARGQVVSDREAAEEELVIEEREDKTTYIACNFGNVYNTQTAVLHFRVRAREDYIGSNQVLTNEGTPKITYNHTPHYPDGSADEQHIYSGTVDCGDVPMVNVPVRFEVTDGRTAYLTLGEEADLEDLSHEIVRDVQDRADNYDQIRGTLSYSWILPGGEEIFLGSAVIENGTVQEGFPDRSYLYKGTEAGEYAGSLKVTFTPAQQAAETYGNAAYSDEITGIPVGEAVRSGEVQIIVSPDARLTIRKVVADPAPGEEERLFRIRIEGTDLSGAVYQTDVILTNGQSVTARIPCGTYKLREILPMGYRLSSVTGDLSENGGTVTVDEDRSHAFVVFENAYVPEGFFHGSAGVTNRFSSDAAGGVSTSYGSGEPSREAGEVTDEVSPDTAETAALKEGILRLNMDNRIRIGTVAGAVSENFPDPVLEPGKTKVKEVAFQNTGTADALIRVSFAENWIVKSGAEEGFGAEYLTSLPEGREAAQKLWTASWEKDWQDGGDGWYYYRKVLPAGDETETVLSGIAFPGAMDEQYQKCEYRLDFQLEMVQASDEERAAREAASLFGKEFDLTGNAAWAEDKYAAELAWR